MDTLFSSIFSDVSERRVWLSAESKILASTFGRFRLYRLKSNFWSLTFHEIMGPRSYKRIYYYHIITELSSDSRNPDFQIPNCLLRDKHDFSRYTVKNKVKTTVLTRIYESSYFSREKLIMFSCENEALFELFPENSKLIIIAQTLMRLNKILRKYLKNDNLMYFTYWKNLSFKILTPRLSVFEICLQEWNFLVSRNFFHEFWFQKWMWKWIWA